MLTKKFIEKTFPKGKLTLVGGHPAMGKTSFAISLTISLAELNRKCITAGHLVPADFQLFLSSTYKCNFLGADNKQ